MKKIFAIIIALSYMSITNIANAAQPLVDVDWVKKNIGNTNVVFLDVRGKLAGQSKKFYLHSHIPGAVWTNYLKDGWRVKDKSGTVGMLPPKAQLEKLIGSLGISNANHVVIVPAGKKALDIGTATRIYWTFKVLGHKEVSILDGGMRAYTSKRDAKTKKPVNTLQAGEVKINAQDYQANAYRTEMVAMKSDVTAASNSGVVVDNRPNNQFLGLNKHGLAKRYGTVPNAKNLPENWVTKNGGGKFRSTENLRQLYAVAGVPTEGKQINFCNTGHWASLGWFVSSELLGNKDATMYDGSMVEWAADKTLPIQSVLAVK